MKNRSIIIIGGGGHSKVLYDIIKKIKLKIIGFVDKNKNKKFEDCKYLGSDEFILNYSANKVYLINGIGFSKDKNKRKKIYELFKKNNFCFLKLKHPKSIIASNVNLGEGSQIMAGSVVQTGCSIGKNTIINTGALIDHDCKIGDNVHIAPGVILCGNVIIGNNTLIGAGTIITPNVKVGSNIFIKAGQTVSKNKI
tara:strand:+ start:8558 stop:9145 length:588 start_codon:yes stop_codon:yes gene_type:complete